MLGDNDDYLMIIQVFRSAFALIKVVNTTRQYLLIFREIIVGRN